MAVIYIIILIGVLVFVHEFGHYLAARIFKVKVLSFSIGFGPRLTGFKRGDTSWDILTVSPATSNASTISHEAVRILNQISALIIADPLLKRTSERFIKDPPQDP